MSLNRRSFIQLSGLSTGAGLLTGLSSFSTREQEIVDHYSLNHLQPMTDDIVPITTQERKQRIEKAQQLMQQKNIKAIVLDAGTSMDYFTGVSWWGSERPMVVVIPFKGDPRYICPAFEEDRLKELISLGKDVFIWQEDESPYKQIAAAISDAGIRSGNIGIEERLRFFIFDGLRKEASHLNYTSADPVTIPCRIIKSPAEIALMQKATDITTAAIKAGIDSLHEGMAPHEFSAVVAAAHRRLGASHDFALANFAEASALPHGSVKPQQLKKGDIILMDCGCSVEGYCSDMSRTIVFGAAPTKRQTEIWELEKNAQAAGFAAAKINAPCESVDAAARKVLTDAGFGPGYQLPGLPHRTGHGIGMDGHEWGNMVKGNKQILQPGMCFSIEPNISIPGEFGVRLEDCVHMTENGPQWFSKPSPSITQPFA